MLRIFYRLSPLFIWSLLIFIESTFIAKIYSVRVDHVTLSTSRPPTPLIRKNLTATPYKTSPRTMAASGVLRSAPSTTRTAARGGTTTSSTTTMRTNTSSTSTTTPSPPSDLINNQFPSPALQPYQYVKAGRITDEQRLMLKLFTNYDRFARPVKNLTHPIVISMSLTITQIFELDEKNMVLITNAWCNYLWRDEYMQWSPSEFSNMEMVRMVSTRLWLPDIVLYNNAADFSPSELVTRAMVQHNGVIFWSVPTKLFSSCKIDVTYFPFDEQICRMKFGSWTWDGFKLDLINSSTTADLTFYVKSGEWDLISAIQRRNVVLYTCCIEPYPDVTFYIHIRRKQLYYFINIFIPCFLMSALTLLAFLLPVESGEKCGLNITIMLSFAVFMLTVIEKLPETSESFPLISIYLSVVLTQTAISTCCTVAILGLNYRSSGSAPLPRWMRRFLNFVAPLCCVHGQSKQWTRSIYPTIVKLTPSEFLMELSRELNHLAKLDSSEIEFCDEFHRNFAVGINRIVDRHVEQVKSDAANADWRRLAQYIDRSLFWLLLVVIVTFCIWILVFYAPAHQLIQE